MSDNQQELDDFDAGFEGTETAQTTTPEQTIANDPVDTPAPKLAHITEDQYQNLLAKATAIDEIKAENKRQFDSAFGKIGGLSQLLTQLQTAAPSGTQLGEVSEEDFEELREQFPDLAALHVKGLNKALSKMRGTGTAAFDPKHLSDLVDQRLNPARETIKQEIRQELAVDTLTELHSDWREVRETPEFKAWKEANSAGLRDAKGVGFDDSWDARFIAKALTAFKDSRKPVTNPKKAGSRFAEAITPRGISGYAPTPSDDDDFEAGFNSRST